ncbi:MAG: MurR/RpiR family transcriptional regulator [Rhodospirillaceae bacterium]
MDLAQVNSILQASYEDLSPQLRQAARYLLANPEEVALTSMRRIAGHAGVKPSTMVRLARAIGFEGFEELREPYRSWLRGGEGAYEARARSLRDRGAGGIHALLREIQEADATALAGTAGPAVGDAIVQAAQTLTGARRVYVLGLRSCYALAHYFHYAYGMVREEVRLVDGSGGTFLDSLRGLGPQDVLLAISFRPYTRETVMALDIAVEAGATVVAVTDSLVSPLARPARHVLLADTTSPNFFQSLVAAQSVIQQLLGATVASIGDDGLQAIKESERRLKQFDAYWQEPRRRRRDGDGDSEIDEAGLDEEDPTP